MTEDQTKFIESLGLLDFKFDMTGISSMYDLDCLIAAKSRLRTSMNGFKLEGETTSMICVAIDDDRVGQARILHVRVREALQAHNVPSVSVWRMVAEALYAKKGERSWNLHHFDDTVQAFRHHLLDQMIVDVRANDPQAKLAL